MIIPVDWKYTAHYKKKPDVNVWVREITKYLLYFVEFHSFCTTSFTGMNLLVTSAAVLCIHIDVVVWNACLYWIVNHTECMCEIVVKRWWLACWCTWKKNIRLCMIIETEWKSVSKCWAICERERSARDTHKCLIDVLFTVKLLKRKKTFKK